MRLCVVQKLLSVSMFQGPRRVYSSSSVGMSVHVAKCALCLSATAHGLSCYMLADHPVLHIANPCEYLSCIHARIADMTGLNSV